MNFEDIIRAKVKEEELNYEATPDWNAFSDKLNNSMPKKIMKKSNVWIYSLISALLIFSVSFYSYLNKTNIQPNEKNNIDKALIITDNNTNKNISNIKNNDNIVLENSITKNEKDSIIFKHKNNEKQPYIEEQKVVHKVELSEANELIESNNQIPIQVSFISTFNKGCVPLVVDFVPNIQSKNYAYNWYVNDSLYSQKIDNRLEFSKAGLYQVRLDLKIHDSIYSYQKNIKIYPKPKAKFFKNKINRTFFEFANETLSNQCNFTWLVNDSIVSLNQNLNYDFINAGKYKITLLAENEYGCADSFDETISVKDEIINIYIPDAFTPNNDGKNDVFMPVFDNKNIDKYRIIIYDKSGKVVYKTSDISNEWNGKMYGTGEDLPQGQYIYEITYDINNNQNNKKIGIVHLKR